MLSIWPSLWPWWHWPRSSTFWYSDAHISLSIPTMFHIILIRTVEVKPGTDVCMHRQTRRTELNTLSTMTTPLAVDNHYSWDYELCYPNEADYTDIHSPSQWTQNFVVRPRGMYCSYSVVLSFINLIYIEECGHFVLRYKCIGLTALVIWEG